VSKAIQYDSLLVRALAHALDQRFSGRPIRAIRMDGAGHTLGIVGPKLTLLWNLDPDGGFLLERREPGRATGMMLPRGTRTLGVSARPDDRMLQWTLTTDADAATGARRFILYIELLPKRRVAVLTEDARVLTAMGPAPSPGARYEMPDARPREGSDATLGRDAFVDLLRDVRPDRRSKALLARIAWTSPLNVAGILGDAMIRDGTDAIEAAWSRWVSLVESRDDDAVVLEPDGLDQPYPAPIDGISFVNAPDLLTAFETAAKSLPDSPDAIRLAALTDRLGKQAAARSKRIGSLRAELDGAAKEAKQLRRDAELLLAQPYRARRGMDSVELDDFAGGTVVVRLDPALDPAANANTLFEQAKRRERASETLPSMIRAAEREVERIEALRERIANRTATDEELAELLPPATSAPKRTQVSLPYRRYRTSSGLEVRVGRGARANDELTLRHSSPEDIWLHARDVGGAHVVLRWPKKDENPAAADITEAAILAAQNSRARTSGVVPVDWTRRKYVRKPRGAPPGQVMVERARTVFVTPDASLEERLRHE
jgi:predicted ribosome quality control (RQC) complex YloA/Tae2 family protein